MAVRAYGNESRNLLSVLDKLHTDALADGRVGLLGLNADLLQHNAFCVRRASSGGGLVDVTEGPLLVGLVRLRSTELRIRTEETQQRQRMDWRGGRGEDSYR